MKSFIKKATAYLSMIGVLTMLGVQNVYPQETQNKIVQQTQDATTKDQALQQSIKDFAKATTKVVLENKDGKLQENQVYSPVSLYTALAMAAEGAHDTTQTELMKVLNVKPNELTNEMNQLLNSLNSDTEKGTLKLANSIWLDKSMQLQKAYEAKMSQSYKAQIFKNYSLESEEAKAAIKQWISDNTNGCLEEKQSSNTEKTSKMEDITQQEKLAVKLINTVYFKSQWQQTFNAALTTQDKFTLSNGKDIKTDFMNGTYKNQRVYKGKKYMASALPFKNGMKLMLILPNEGVTPQELIESDELWHILPSDKECQSTTTVCDVNFKIPKFEFKTQTDLLPQFAKMGIHLATNRTKADFSNLLVLRSDTRAYIGGAKQECYFKVDENGGEAAAVTIIDMIATTCYEEREMIDFDLNRPFVFMLADQNDLPMFVGVINNPTLK